MVQPIQPPFDFVTDHVPSGFAATVTLPPSEHADCRPHHNSDVTVIAPASIAGNASTSADSQLPSLIPGRARSRAMKLTFRGASPSNMASRSELVNGLDVAPNSTCPSWVPSPRTSTTATESKERPTPSLSAPIRRSAAASKIGDSSGGSVDNGAVVADETPAGGSLLPGSNTVPPLAEHPTSSTVARARILEPMRRRRDRWDVVVARSCLADMPAL
jgi:hypothetical protein